MYSQNAIPIVLPILTMEYLEMLLQTKLSHQNLWRNTSTVYGGVYRT